MIRVKNLNEITFGDIIQTLFSRIWQHVSMIRPITIIEEYRHRHRSTGPLEIDTRETLCLQQRKEPWY
jgi:hypothetical protein